MPARSHSSVLALISEIAEVRLDDDAVRRNRSSAHSGAGRRNVLAVSFSGGPGAPRPQSLRIEFELPTEEFPLKASPGTISLDGGSRRYRMLSQGDGVTGYDLEDCLRMVQGVLGQDLLPVAAVLTDPDLSALSGTGGR